MDALYLSGCPGDTRRYRVHHPAEALRLAGWRVGTRAIERLPDASASWPAAPAGGVVILHRVAWSPAVEAYVAAAHARQATVVFDTDDLVFAPEADERLDRLRARLGPASLPFLAPSEAYRRTLLASDGCLVATMPLAEAVAALGIPVAVVPNGLDLEQRRLSGQAFRHREIRADADRLILGYASGTPTHDADFASIQGAVQSVLADRPETRLRLIGPLELDASWEPFARQVERLPLVPWRRLPALLAGFDANLAPLVPTDPFCLAKSALKFFEAGAVGVPTIASATQPFKEAITAGENGVVCRSPDEWETGLRALVADAGRRRALGLGARKTVLDAHVSIHQIATIARILTEFTGIRERSAAILSGSQTAVDGHLFEGGESIETDDATFHFAMSPELVAAAAGYRSGESRRTLGPWLAAWLAKQYGTPSTCSPYPVDPSVHFAQRSGTRPPTTLPDLAITKLGGDIALDLRHARGELSDDLGVRALMVAAGILADLSATIVLGAGQRPEPLRTLLGKAGLAVDVVLDPDLGAEAELWRRSAVLLAPGWTNISAKVVQAMACGCPVVAVDQPTVRWLLVNGETARLAPPNAEALALALAEVLTNPGLAAQLADGGLAAVESFGPSDAAAQASANLDQLQGLSTETAWLSEGSTLTVGQTFVASFGRLTGLDLLLEVRGRPRGQVKLTLRRFPGDAMALGECRVPLSEVDPEDWTAFALADLDLPAGSRSYAEVSLETVESTASSDWTNAGDEANAPAHPPNVATTAVGVRRADRLLYHRGLMYADGEATAASLAFRTWSTLDVSEAGGVGWLGAAEAGIAPDALLRRLEMTRQAAKPAEEALAAALAAWPYRLLGAPVDWLLAREWPRPEARPWSTGTPLGTKLVMGLRHPVALAAEVADRLRWQRLSAAERSARRAG